MDQQSALAAGMRGIWPGFVLSLGVVATVAWVAFLGWLSYRGILMLG